MVLPSHWSPVSELPDSPQNYQQVSWALAERDGGTELTIMETNLPSEEAKAVSVKSWQIVLDKLKTLLESPSGSNPWRTRKLRLVLAPTSWTPIFSS